MFFDLINTVIVLLNSEKLKAFSLRSGTRQDTLSHHFSSIEYWES